MGFPAIFYTNSLNGNNGFTLTSSSRDFGYAVAGIGDINGDSKSDFIVSDSSSTSYIVFGASSFPVTLDASTLNGNNGFTLTSSSTGLGYSVAGIGDINGDGKPDFTVGIKNENKGYVIYGASSFPATLDTSALSGNNGFTLISSTNGFGYSVAGIGDINGDGQPDFVIGATRAIYVVYGTSSFPATFDINSLNGNNGFTLTSPSDGFGYSVAGIGDINGDGKPDLAIGASRGTEAYVVFGASSFPSTFDTSRLDGRNGFKLTLTNSYLGQPISGIGDINSDGKSDFIIGYSNAGEGFVVYGARFFPSTFDTSTLNGNNGFKLTSSYTGIGSSFASLGDINGDGQPDFAACGIRSAIGEAYIVYGAKTFPGSFEASKLDGTNGFAVSSPSSSFGHSVAGLGDINGDGEPDFIIGTLFAKAYVVFGTSESTPTPPIIPTPEPIAFPFSSPQLSPQSPEHTEHGSSTLPIALGVCTGALVAGSLVALGVYMKVKGLFCFADQNRIEGVIGDHHGILLSDTP